ncbi:MAG: hypothetical protein A2270_03895 [Elusimicrobia bacterium RIFOXYA12_FULL_51_18]|nr:MAG: hypothetical protein A2270_03895 [Elusimicrobia bacterium RIFOXYA12_FULL_51_18]OGS29893.1 MAG: hypothetical protein A2218_02595 [Elusimicrobia bacterium RIFOXYA2_FULL_53_38]
MKTIVTLLALIGGNCMAAEITNWEFKAGEARSIRMNTEAGGVTLVAAEGSSVKAEIVGEYSTEKCEIRAEVSGGELLLKASAKKRWFWKNSACKTGFKVYAPAGTKIFSKTSAGNVEVGAFSSGADISVGAGNIKLAGLSGPIKISIGAGNVKGEIYSEDMACKTGTGALDLDWKNAPKAGKASIHAGMGTIALSFPAESKLNISNSTGMGGFNSEIGSDPSAAFRLDIKNGMGSTWIKKS